MLRFTACFRTCCVAILFVPLFLISNNMITARCAFASLFFSAFAAQLQQSSTLHHVPDQHGLLHQQLLRVGIPAEKHLCFRGMSNCASSNWTLFVWGLTLFIGGNVIRLHPRSLIILVCFGFTSVSSTTLQTCILMSRKPDTQW